jgi:hypothetical protein
MKETKMKTRAFPGKIASMLVAVTLIFTLLPAESRALPASPSYLQMEYAKTLFKNLTEALNGLRCTGADAGTLRSAGTMLDKAKASMNAGRYGEAITHMQKARSITFRIPETASRVRHLNKLRSGARLFVALCAVVIIGSVMANRAEASDGVVRPRKIAEQTRDSVPAYFDLIERSGCHD